MVAEGWSIEKGLHAEYAGKNSHGEWFALTDDDVNRIIETYGLMRARHMEGYQSWFSTKKCTRFMTTSATENPPVSQLTPEAKDCISL